MTHLRRTTPGLAQGFTCTSVARAGIVRPCIVHLYSVHLRTHDPRVTEAMAVASVHDRADPTAGPASSHPAARWLAEDLDPEALDQLVFDHHLEIA